MIFLSDIDKTIAELTEEQKHFVLQKNMRGALLISSENKKKLSWEKDYYAYISKQEPIEGNMAFIQNLFNYSNRCFFSTGRHENYRRETEDWLGKFGFSEQVLMRKKDDYREAFKVKKDNLDAIRNVYGGKNYLVIDDDPDCQNMYEREGCYLICPPGGLND